MKEQRTLKEGFNIYSPEDHLHLSEADRARIRNIYESAAEDAGADRDYADEVYEDSSITKYLVVYVSGGELVSCCLIHWSKRLPGMGIPLSWVYTEPDQRRKSYASKMLSALIKYLVEQTKAPMIYLTEATDMAVGLYESVGFTRCKREVGTTEHYIFLDDIRRGGPKPPEVLEDDEQTYKLDGTTLDTDQLQLTRLAGEVIFKQAVRGVTGYATRETEDFFTQWVEQHIRKGAEMTLTCNKNRSRAHLDLLLGSGRRVVVDLHQNQTTSSSGLRRALEKELASDRFVHHGWGITEW